MGRKIFAPQWGRLAAVYIVSGANREGMVTSPHAKLDDALAKVGEFISAGMTHVGIRDLDQSTYLPEDIELLVRMTNVEIGDKVTVVPEPVVAKRPWWKWSKG